MVVTSLLHILSNDPGLRHSPCSQITGKMWVRARKMQSKCWCISGINFTAGPLVQTGEFPGPARFVMRRSIGPGFFFFGGGVVVIFIKVRLEKLWITSLTGQVHVSCGWESVKSSPGACTEASCCHIHFQGGIKFRSPYFTQVDPNNQAVNFLFKEITSPVNVMRLEPMQKTIIITRSRYLSHSATWFNS